MIVKLGSLISEYSVRNKADEDIPVYSVTNEQGFCTGYFSKEVASQDRTTYKIVPRGCFAYNPSRINVGSVDVQECEDRVIVSPLYVVFSVDEKLNRRYLLHYLKSDITLTYIKAYASGSVRDNLKFSILKDFPINLPSAEEQEQIVATLDGIEHLIALRKEELNSLDELVKSRFIELFGDPIRNEKGWPIVTLGEVAEIRIGPFGSLLHREDYIVGGHALVNPSHIIDGNICTDDNLTVSDEKYEELSAYRLSIGDLVLGRRGEMGRCAVVYEDGLLCGTGSIIIRPKEKMKPYFLQNIISSPGYKRIIEDKAVGVTMMNLNVPIVSSLTIPLLPIDMQEQFIAFMHQTDKSKFFACQTLSFLLKLANNLQSWREKQYDY